MGKIFWSVDEKKYNDQSAHTLILSGWAADTEERKECELLLYGDGEELPALKISRHYRADVAKNLTELGEVNAGFPGWKFRKYRNLPENMQNWNSSLSMEERKSVSGKNQPEN